MIGKINTDQTDAFRAHQNRQTKRDIRRIVRVMQAHFFRKNPSRQIAEFKFDDVRMFDGQIQLRKKIFGLRRFDIFKTVARKLIFRIDDDQIIRLKFSPDIVHADGDKAFRSRKSFKRFAAAADD